MHFVIPIMNDVFQLKKERLLAGWKYPLPLRQHTLQSLPFSVENIFHASDIGYIDVYKPFFSEDNLGRQYQSQR